MDDHENDCEEEIRRWHEELRFDYEVLLKENQRLRSQVDRLRFLLQDRE